ncbi:peptidylprolyl isomerase [Viscerimonas tarda]
MKRYFCRIISLFSLLFVCYNSNAQDNVIDQVIWVVGDESILKSEVETVRRDMLVSGKHFEGDPYCFIPEQLAVQKLYLHQAKIDSIDVPLSSISRDVETDLNSAINFYGSKEKLEEYEGKPLNELREDLRTRRRDGAIMRQTQSKIVGDVRLTPSEIRKYYSSLPQDSLPFIPTTVEVQIMTMQPVTPIKEIDAVKARLRDFTDRVNKGDADFATLALMYSEDVESAKRGGELGFTGRAQLVPEFSSAAFALTDTKKISNIVETEYGFHIIQLIERRGDRINVRHILLKPKASAVETNRIISRMDSIVSDIDNKRYTFEEAVGILSSDKDTRNNKGLMVNKNNYGANAGTSRFEMNELPQEVAKIVNNLAVGELSKPFTMLNEKGKEVVAIAKLKQRVEGHRANVSDDYQALKAIVENNKREDILKKWLETKIKTTYIWIHNDWKNCDFSYSGWVK